MTERRAAYRTRKPRTALQDAERAIWKAQGVGSGLELDLLSQLRVAGVPEPVKQAKLHPTRNWRFDFAWPALRVIVEVQGGTWTGGAHTRGAGYERDRRKSAEMQLLGWLVLEFTAGMVKSGEAVGYIQTAIRLVKDGRL